MINQKLLDNIKAHGIWKDTGEGRRKLLEDIGFRVGEKAEYVIITGCAPPESLPHVFRAFKELLDYLKIDYSLLDKEYCCGWMPLGQPAVMAKNEEDIARSKELSQEFVRENFRQAEALRAKAITLFCAACEPTYTNNAGETNLDIISQSELLDRYYAGGKLDQKIDYYAGCYRFRRRITNKPVDIEAPLRLLNRIEGLKVNYLDNNLCCYIPPGLDQLAESVKSKTVVTICPGCTGNVTQKLRDNGDYQVKMLPEILLEAVRNE
ncbi:heterodisulfide reductase-related iron-sulfur binding cluster [Chloroflexota bacterium]